MGELCLHGAKFKVSEKDGILIYNGKEFNLLDHLIYISSNSMHQKPVIKKIWFSEGYLFLNYHLERGRWTFKIDGEPFVWNS